MSPGARLARDLPREVSSFLNAARLHVGDAVRDPIDLLLNLIDPVFYATVAVLLLRAGSSDLSLTDVTIGTGLMGAWSTVLFGSATLIRTQRQEGTLELLLAAPRSFASMMLPITLATTLIGGLGLLLACLYGAVAYGAEFALSHLAVTGLAALVTVLSMGAVGTLIAAVFVGVRRAESVASPLLVPLWGLSGIIIPTSSLPAWVQPVSHCLPTSWGAEAIRAADAGEGVLTSLAVCALLAGVYLVVGSMSINALARRARATGEASQW